LSIVVLLDQDISLSSCILTNVFLHGKFFFWVSLIKTKKLVLGNVLLYLM